MKGRHTQTLIPRVLSLPIETTSQTRGSRIQTNKEISPLLTKCGEIPHKKKNRKKGKQKRVLTNYSQVNQRDSPSQYVKNKIAFWEYLSNVNKGYWNLALTPVLKVEDITIC